MNYKELNLIGSSSPHIRTKDGAGHIMGEVLLAMLLLFFASLTARLAAGEGAALLYGFLVNTALLSVGLGLFNLVPIPPLDGSKVLFALLPERAYYTLMRYERYGMAVLLLLVWLDVGGGYLSEAIYRVFMWMAGLFF